MLRQNHEALSLSGDYQENDPLTHDKLLHLLQKSIYSLNMEHVRREVTPFIRDKRALDVWSLDFFSQAIKRIISILYENDQQPILIQ